MSLINKLFVSEQKPTANQASGRQSHGPVTEEGREHIRASSHGYCSQVPGAKMNVLAEHPHQAEPLFEPLMKLKAGSNEVRGRRQGRKKFGTSHDVIESK